MLRGARVWHSHLPDSPTQVTILVGQVSNKLTCPSGRYTFQTPNIEKYREIHQNIDQEFIFLPASAIVETTTRNRGTGAFVLTLRIYTTNESLFNNQPADMKAERWLVKCCWQSDDHVALVGEHVLLLLGLPFAFRNPFVGESTINAIQIPFKD